MLKSALVGLASSAATTIGAMVGGVSEEHGTLLFVLATLVGTVVGTVAWIDSRIDKKIKLHNRQDDLRHDAVLGEIRHLRELLAFADVIPATTPAARFLAQPPPSDDDTQP